MAPDKSLAAEIEAVMRKHISFDVTEDDAGMTCAVIGFRVAAAEIAALTRVLAALQPEGERNV